MWRDFKKWLYGKFRGISAIMAKEWIEIRKDKGTLVIAAIGASQGLFFGYGLTFEVRDVRTIVLDQDKRPQAQILLDQLVATRYFHVIGQATSRAQVTEATTSGHARVGIVIPPHFSDKIQHGQSGQAQVLIDGCDSMMANAIQTTSLAVGLNRSIQLASAGKATPMVDVRPRILFNPELRSQNSTLPALVALTTQTVLVFFTVTSIVRELERGTLELLLVTPVTPLGLMVGKLIPYWIIGLIGANMLLAMTHLWFQVPMNGSLLVLELGMIIFTFVSLSLGVLISCTAGSLERAIHMTVLVIIPSALLSGFLFPRESMPWILNWLGYAFPVTYFVQIERGVALRGASIADLWQWYVSLAALGLFFMYLSVKRFRKTLS